MKALPAKWRVVAALAPILVLEASAIIFFLNWPDEAPRRANSRKTQTEAAITPEQARAALLKLGSLRVVTGGEDDPIAVDLRSGVIAWTDGSNVTIGRFFSCNLQEKTWRMGVTNGRTGRLHFSAGANGRF